MQAESESLDSLDQECGGVAATVAVIIPCRNEQSFIGKCLDSLIANDYDREKLQIVVVDGQSEDRTLDILADYRRRYPFIRVIENPARIIPAALNLGIRQTNSEIVMRADAHATYDADYISYVVDGLRRHRADCFGTTLRTEMGETALEIAMAIAMSHPFAVGNAYYRVGSKNVREVDGVFPGCWPRELFDKVGFFNEHLPRTQDREFSSRIKAAGGRVLLDPSAKITYYPRKTLKGFFKWNFVGAGWLFFAKRFTTAKMLSWRNFVPVSFLAYHAVPILAWALYPLLGLLATTPLVFYWLAAFIFAAKAAKAKRRFAIFPVLCFLFPLTHYAYGLGSLVGMLRYLFSKPPASK